MLQKNGTKCKSSDIFRAECSGDCVFTFNKKDNTRLCDEAERDAYLEQQRQQYPQQD